MCYLHPSRKFFNGVTVRTVKSLWSTKIKGSFSKMGCTKPAIVVFTLVACTVIVSYFCYALFTGIFTYMDEHGKENVVDNWIFRLFLNVLGYGTVVLPGILLYYYVQRTHLLEDPNRTCLTNFLRKVFYDYDKKGYENLDTASRAAQTTTFLQDAVRLLFCSVGLLVSYLIWGLEQERIMTQVYKNSAGQTDKFQDSQYLVFINRILAMVIAGGYNFVVQQPRHSVPYYKYFYCSFSNVMSSWCQYEALKFISFPTQVISKTCKIIPVMLMGKVVSKRKYDNYEYIVALLICVGMVLFLMGSPDAVTNTSNQSQTVTTFSGIILIIGYMSFDSFTSNWQSELFTKYSVTSMQMMFGVNLFSALLTTVSLIQQGSFVAAFYFSIQYPQFLFDCVYLSICSAVGQLFVYYTISCFGPVVFIIIMTVRQGVAIILSCFTYQHFVDWIGVFGIVLVFFAIFLRIYCSQRIKKQRSKRAQANSSTA